MTSLPFKLDEYLDQFARRVTQEALATATAAYWRGRAEAFRRVGTPRCDEVAQACENRARVSLLGGDVEEFCALLEDAS